MNIATLEDAKCAVRTFWAHRDCLPDTCMVQEAVDAIRDAVSEARETRTPWDEQTWRSLAEMVDEACADDGLPRLYRTEV